MLTNNFAKGVLRPKRVAARIAKTIGIGEWRFRFRVTLPLACVSPATDRLSQRYNLSGPIGKTEEV